MMDDIVDRLRSRSVEDRCIIDDAGLMQDAADEIMRLRQIVLPALRWRQYNPEPIPAVVPQAMNITTRVALTKAIDDFLDTSPLNPTNA